MLKFDLTPFVERYFPTNENENTKSSLSLELKSTSAIGIEPSKKIKDLDLF